MFLRRREQCSLEERGSRDVVNGVHRKNIVVSKGGSRPVGKTKLGGNGQAVVAGDSPGRHGDPCVKVWSLSRKVSSSSLMSLFLFSALPLSSSVCFVFLHGCPRPLSGLSCVRQFFD